MSQTQKYIVEPQRQVPVTEQRDVIVAGGGVTGVMAAVAAARAGADTLLVEARSHLGAVATMGLPLQGYCDRDGHQIVGGLAEEFRQRLMAIGGATDFIPCAMHNPYVVVDPECVKIVCQQMLLESGAKLLLHAPVVSAVTEGGHIQAVIIEGKSGREAARGGVYIDCTGDADVAFRAGADCDMEPAERLQTNTLNMILAGVDTEKIQRCVREDPERFKLFSLLDPDELTAHPRYILVGLKELADDARREHPEWGHLWNIACYITLVSPGMVCINSVHTDNLLATDTRELTRIEISGRAQAQQALAFYRGYIPGFENARLVSTGPWTGVRETRRLRGLRRLTVDGIREGARSDEDVALGGYPVDIHDPDTNQLVFYKVPVYGIPYGCMLSDRVDNLLVAGRAISATHEAMASSRVMAQCMALGQAAGTAAALCRGKDVSARALDTGALRAVLRGNGQIL